MQTTNLERSFPVAQVIDLIQAEFQQYNLYHQIYSSGQAIKTTQVLLFDSSDGLLQHACGKGIGRQSEASAFCEAMEHFWDSAEYFHAFPDFQSRGAIEWFAPNELPYLESLIGDMPIDLLLKHMPDEVLPCLRYKAFSNEKTLYYPLFLSVPDYDKQPLAGDTFEYGLFTKYSSNNGTAVGMSIVEAAIHALSEVIERDCFSTMLLSRYFASQNLPLPRVIDKNTLPGSLKRIVSTVEHEMSDDLILLDITNDFQVPTFYATCTRQRGCFVQPNGFGSSISREYAVERAVLEVLQHYHTAEFLGGDDDDFVPAYTFFSEHGLYPYARAAKYDHTDLLDMSPTSFETVVVHETPSNLDDYLALLVSLVENNGYEPFYHVNHQAKSGITSVKALVPKAERFFICTGGHLVVPGVRGQQFLTVD